MVLGWDGYGTGKAQWEWLFRLGYKVDYGITLQGLDRAFTVSFYFISHISLISRSFFFSLGIKAVCCSYPTSISRLEVQTWRSKVPVSTYIIRTR